MTNRPPRKPYHIPVLYRMFEGECTAVFPTLPGTRDPDTMACYAHIGQHGTGTHAWYKTTRAAERWQYMALHKALRAIYGRDLRIVPCITQKMRAERRKAVLGVTNR